MRWFFGIIAALLIASGTIFYNLYLIERHGIYDFDDQRDTAFILNFFNNDWYWLVAGKRDVDFFPEYFLKHRASSTSLMHKGNETIKVMFEHNKPVGFVSYYPLKFYEGRIHFLAIDKQYRSKGYGLAMINYAIDQLCKQGFQKISIITRRVNQPALKVYKRAGFKESHEINGFVYLNYYPPNS